MGRIKTKRVKRVSNELVKEHRDKFTSSFAENKIKVVQLAEIRSKKLLNTITGYVTRLVKAKEE